MLVCFSGKSAKQQQLFIISAPGESETRVYMFYNKNSTDKAVPLEQLYVYTLI